jgi:hypothetical protein
MSTYKQTTGVRKMKRLTKKDFKKMIREYMATGLTSFEAMDSLQYEYDMYHMVIMDARTEVAIEDFMAAQK